MEKRFWVIGLLGLVLAGPHMAWGNSFFSRSPPFDLPNGAIAFMGCYWSPLPILGKGEAPSPQAPFPTSPGTSTNFYNSGGVKMGIDSQMAGQMLGDAIMGSGDPPPTPADATILINQVVLDKSANLKLSLMPVAYSVPYQNALLMHILNPAKWGYNPGLTRYCGMRPYILIGIIDFCDAYPNAANIREKENDQKIAYLGKRSILEKDDDIFAVKNAQRSVALEFFLVSTVDGSVLWQGNLEATGVKMSGYKGLTNGLVENALKNLMKK